MNISAVIDEIREEFPFEGYMPEDGGNYRTVGDIVSKYLEPGQSVFDFGCGPCDKTAVVAKLGMRCTAFDDLQDNWHKVDNNREKIRAFAQSQGISLQEHLEPEEGAPYDLVMLNDVLENLPISPRVILTDLIEFLRPEGYLFVSVPNLSNLRKRISLLFGRTVLGPYPFYFWYDGPWRGPFREYVRKDLLLMGRFLDLELIELTTRHHMLRKLPAKILVPFYKAFSTLFPGIADTWVAVYQKPTGWTRDRVSPTN
jgi:SAM-dependent methyltransferase